MKLEALLATLPDSTLDLLAADKVDESITFKLPRVVLTQEVIAALSSLSYISKVLAPSKPPTYCFLKLLLEASDQCLPVEGFQDKVMEATHNTTTRAATNEGLSTQKNYGLYLKILRTAWENGEGIDRSEEILLEALRTELGLWTREHLILEHNPDVRKLWDTPSAYVNARNYLLKTGLILTHGNSYCIADEVASQIRRAWGMEMSTASYHRLLTLMNREQLHKILENTGLTVSGTKETQIGRLVEALVPPTECLEIQHIDEIRDLSRQVGIASSGRKGELMANLIDWFSRNMDLVKEEVISPEAPPVPEIRILEASALSQLLRLLTNDQLYDILSTCSLRTSGSKDEKIGRLMDSHWSEKSLLSSLRRIDLVHLCRQIDIPISGIKDEILDRVVEKATSLFDSSTEKALVEDLKNHAEIKEAVPLQESTALPNIPVAKEPIDASPDLKKMQSDYPFLSTDEHLILSLLKEGKSFTEQDLDRAASNHDLGWFLTKAHMADMLFKLRKSGASPFRIRSVRSVNIYEWTGDTSSVETGVEMHAARDVMDALRQGVVPAKHLDLLVVGQNQARDHLMTLLGHVGEKKSAFKFIRGPYGAGKTFLCSWFRDQALREEFAISSVSIGPDQPLSDLPVFFSGMIQGLRTPEKSDSSALADILESWLLEIHRKASRIEGISPFTTEGRKRLALAVETLMESQLAGLSEFDPGLASALRSFYLSRLNGDAVTASAALAWISGSRSLPGSQLKAIGVRGVLEANLVFPRMRALLEIVNGARYRGLLLLVDELELIRKFPHTRQREQALETLRLLIDETGKGALPGCLLICTGTDNFFEDERAGLRSYEALADRVLVPGAPEGMESMRQPVITLKELNQERLLTVLGKVRFLHGSAYKWEAETRFDDALMNNLVQEWTTLGSTQMGRKPRPILREFIHLLDLCEENPQVNPREFVHAPESGKSNQQDPHPTPGW